MIRLALAALLALTACGPIEDAPIDVGTSQKPICTYCFRPRWTTPALSSWWTGEGVGYARDPFGWVHLTGQVTSGGPGEGGSNLVFTLPAGYRPAYLTVRKWYDSDSEESAYVAVKPNGEVWVMCTVAPGRADLSVMTFYAP